MKTKIISIIAFPLFVCAAAYAQGITWIPANPMNKARAFFTATKLLNGDVLVAGGYDGTVDPPVFPDAEIYNRQTGLWTPISPMNLARAAAVDVRLEDGRVLVIGGADADFNFLDSAEIYDPSTGTWSFTGSMNEPRFEDFVGVLLPGHKVLIAGGFGPPFNALNSAEIYDEATNTWTPTGSMNVARAEFAHVVLHDGRVLAVGGVADDLTAIASAEIYDPATGVWTLTGSMSTGRNDAAVVVLQDGRVLAAGGGMGDEELPRYASAEIFDPHTGQWTSTGSMTAPRSETEHAVLRLRDGRVLGARGPHSSACAGVKCRSLQSHDRHLVCGRLHERSPSRSRRGTFGQRHSFGDGRVQRRGRAVHDECRYCEGCSAGEAASDTAASPVGVSRKALMLGNSRVPSVLAPIS